ncbi:hypothetical protein [Streptomyces collinus]|uniref:hypothetical protein n=1 Tax=Streptomyces collinus TaxID=42684 RepID=UPI00367505B7
MAQQEQKLPGQSGTERMLLVHAQQRNVQFTVAGLVAVSGQQTAVLVGDLLPNPPAGRGSEVPQPLFEGLLLLPGGLVEEDQMLLFGACGDSCRGHGGAEEAAELVCLCAGQFIDGQDAVGRS